jgi:HEAT repeat protein
MRAPLALIMATAFALTTAAALAQTPPPPSARPAHTAAEIDRLLARIATYEIGANPAPPIEFDELVEQSLLSADFRKVIETRLLQFLQRKATAAGKDVAFRALSLVGTNASIPVLAPLLTRVETAEMARYALAAIPGPAADDALRKSLGQAPNLQIRIGIVGSLGHRKDTNSVSALAALLSYSDPELTGAVVAALANIADRPSLDALAAARSKASGQVRDLVAEAYVACADQFAARGEKATAVSVYKQMIAPGEPQMTRTRALASLTAAEGKDALPSLTAAIESGDAQMQPVAIRLLNGIPGPDITRALVAEIPKVPPLAQVHLLTALAWRGDAAARPAVLAALKSDVPEVRAAALAGLGKLGDESSVMVLAQAAAAGKEPEQSAARRSLAELRGPGIDHALVMALGSASGSASGSTNSSANGNVKTELIVAAGERGSGTAADALAQAAHDRDPETRRAALRALRNVGGAGQAQALLDLLVQAPTPAERRDATQTLAMVLRRSPSPPVGAVISAYNNTSAIDARLSLIEVMGQTSSDEALPLLRSSVNDANPQIARAAVLALTAWDTPAPLMDLFNLAKGGPRTVPVDQPDPLLAGPGVAGAGRGGRGGGAPPTNNMQVLALRGVLKLLLAPSQRPVSESGRMLGESMRLASQTAEKINILSMLPYFPSKESLAVAQAAVRDEAVANEAKVAVAQLQEALKLK